MIEGVKRKNKVTARPVMSIQANPIPREIEGSQPSEGIGLFLKMIRPGLVYPSGKPATRPDYDCEVGRLLSRELVCKSGQDVYRLALDSLKKVHENVTKKGFTKRLNYGIISV